MLLDRLLGAWATSMQHVQLAEPVVGLQDFERALNGAFLMMRSSAEHPEIPDALALLDERSMSYFDTRGISRIFELEVSDSGFSQIRRDEDFWQRSTTTFVGTDVMEAVGENSHDEGVTWEHDFTMTFTRIG